MTADEKLVKLMELADNYAIAAVMHESADKADHQFQVLYVYARSVLLDDVVADDVVAEPVAVIDRKYPNYFTWLVRRATLPDDGTKLYAHPPAQPRAAVPDGHSRLDLCCDWNRRTKL